MISEPDRTVARALAYTRHGWPVFPCRPGGKEPATRHGFHDATTDHDQIRSQWQVQPAANIAVATAGLPGPDVLDVDQRGEAGNGFAACRRLNAVGLRDGAAAVVATPGGRLHCYFAGSCQRSTRLSAHHLDFRAASGYVLMPPSRVNGSEYRLIRHRSRIGGLDWSAVTSLHEPQRGGSCQSPGTAVVDAGRLVARVGHLEEGNPNCGAFLGRVPGTRNRPAPSP